MSTQDLLNESHITNARVYIEGDEIRFVSLCLEQAFSAHHTFSVVLDYDSLKQDFMKNPLEQIKQLSKGFENNLILEQLLAMMLPANVQKTVKYKTAEEYAGFRLSNNKHTAYLGINTRI